MNPVQPVGNAAAGVAPAQAAQPQAVSSSGTSAQAVAQVSSSVSMSVVHTQVDAMLQTIGGGLQDNELLRMVIALLIMQALLAKDGGNQQSAIDGLIDYKPGGNQRATELLA